MMAPREISRFQAFAAPLIALAALLAFGAPVLTALDSLARKTARAMEIGDSVVALEERLKTARMGLHSRLSALGARPEELPQLLDAEAMRAFVSAACADLLGDPLLDDLSGARCAVAERPVGDALTVYEASLALEDAPAALLAPLDALAASRLQLARLALEASPERPRARLAITVARIGARADSEDENAEGGR